MQKVIFLDRDGVLNKEIGEYITHADMFELNTGVSSALKILRKRGYQFIVITNQGGLAKGLYSHQTLTDIHNKMKSLLNADGVTLMDIYYCPHHPDFTKCLCRKPGSLMLEKAIAKYDVDVAASYFIGDADRDIIAAAVVGIKTIKVDANQDLSTTLHLIQ